MMSLSKIETQSMESVFPNNATDVIVNENK